MENKKMFELTAPQNSIWIMEQFYKGTNINNICATMTINTDVDIKKLNKAINIFLQNNKSFGLKFKVVGGKLKQYFTTLNDIQFECIKLKDKNAVKKLAKDTAEEIFDIEHENLFKFKLYKLENNYAGFVVMTHHLISDAGTMSLIGKEIAEIYSKLISKEKIEKKEYSYEQYILEESEYLKSPKFIKNKEYWTGIYETVPEVATIPGSVKNLNTVQTVKSARQEFILNIDLLHKIGEFCNKNKISNFNFFMAVYAIYLSRVSNLKDFVIGTPILNRTNFKEKHTTGMFINTAPLRIKIEDNIDFVSFVKSIAQSSMSMLRYQKYSYQMLLEELRKKDSSLPTLYDVMLSYQVTKANDRDLELPYEVEWIPSTTISNGIYVNLHDNDDEGTLNVDYDYQVERYTKQDIKNIHKRILHIIKQVLENEKCLEKDIEIIMPEEKNQILNVFNNTEVNYQKDKTIVDLFEEQVEKNPDNIAVVCSDKSLTYKELNDKANALAMHLIEKGIQTGDVIATLLNRNIELITSMLAIIKCGAIYLPISTEFPKERIEYILQNSQAKFLVTMQQNKEEYKEIKRINIDEFKYNEFSIKNLRKKIKPEDILYIIYTSGSTGKPKGVEISNGNLNNFVNAFSTYFGGISKEDKCLSTTNITFDVSIFEFYIPLLNGATLYLYEENSITDIFKFCESIEKNKITLLYIPPNILDETYTILSECKKLRMQKILIGVEPIKSNIIKKYFTLNPNMKIVNAYGPTETTICATANVLSKESLDKYTIIPIGKPLLNNKILILNKQLQLVPIGVKGELYILGDGVGHGYLNNKQKTEESFLNLQINGKTQRAYKTGDLASWNEDGTINFIGREDNQVKVNGHRIELGEIESCIYKYANIEKAIVMLDENNKIIAYYVAKKQINVSELKKFIAKQLPQYFIPNTFLQVDKFELTANGKIDKKKLIKVKDNIKVINSPKNEMQKSLEKIIKEILNKTKISIDDNFFEIGGDSLSAIKLSTKIYDTFGIKLEIKELFNNATIVELEKLLKSKNKTRKIREISKIENSDFYPTSTAQKRIYYASAVNEKSTLYNIAGGIIFERMPDIEKMKNSINKLVETHSILRTTLELIDGELFQKINNFEPDDIKARKVNTNNIDDVFKAFRQPFKLLSSKLFRYEIVELLDGRALFMIDIHHSICDGTSLDILLKELCKIYNGEKVFKPSIEYKDFAKWESEKLKNNKFSSAEEYWLNEFKDGIPILNLPTTYEKTSVEHVGAIERVEISEEIRKKVDLIAKKLKCTQYMIYLAIYYILLNKYTNQNDIVVGTPITGRYIPEIENIIGMFVNTLALRSKIDNRNTFSQYVKKVKETCLNAYNNQEYPLEELSKKVNTQREDGKSILFDTMFIYQNNGYSKVQLDDIKAQYYIPKSNVSKFDISLELIPKESKSIDVNIEYNTDLFNKEYVKNFGMHYLKIIEEICTNYNIKISEINMLTLDEQQRLEIFNNTKVDFEENNTVIEVFENQVKNTPDKTALVFEDKLITYKELNGRANGLAKKMLNKKIKPLDVVAILLPRSENLVISMLAILKLGCTYMIIDSNLPNERIEYMLLNSKATLLITSESEKYVKFKNKIYIEKEQKSLVTNIKSQKNIEAPFSIIFTSGSTGKPKGVIIRNKGIKNLLYSYENILKVSKYETFLSMCSISFDMFTVEIFLPLFFGKKVILTNEEQHKSPVDINELIKSYKIDMIFITPSKFELLLTAPNCNNIKKLKNIQFGGENFKKYLYKEIKKISEKIEVYNEYGPSEITSCCSIKHIKSENDISIGRPIDNVQIYVVNDSNNICPIGIKGEICVTGKGVAIGYINNQELTSESFIPNPFGEGYMYKTGDIGILNSNNELEYIDRKDSQIKIRGLRVELSEIEKQILNIIKLRKCAVIYKKDKGYISAFICADQKINISDVRKLLEQKLPIYMIPKYITQLEDLPLNTNGKVNKKILEKYKDDEIENLNYVEPETEQEKIFCSVWEKLLHKKIGVENDVFECGADSLIAIKFKTELLAYNIEVSYSDLFKYKTVRNLCQNTQIKNLESKDIYDYNNINTILKKNDIKFIKKIVTNNNNNLLLFGATGFVGMHIIDSFIKNDKGIVYCIVRDKNNKSAQERFLETLHFYFGKKLDKMVGKRIIVLKANLLKPNFELSNKTFNMLIKNINVVINSAAIVKHFGDESKFIEVNVNSTQNIIDFCMENDKKLIQISSLSVSGNTGAEGEADNKLDGKHILFTEKNLYIEQNLKNPYIKSKFEAERLILENISKGLKAQILRLGNITNRYEDGRFQINPEENAFANKIKAFINLKMIPEYLLKEYIEFTPVDSCAQAIIKVMQNYSKNISVLHIYNNEHLYLEKFIKYLKFNNIDVDIVNQSKFKEKIDNILKEKTHNDILMGIINDFDKEKKITYGSNIEISSEFSRNFLKSVGFVWPKIDKEYIAKYLKYLKKVKFI